MITNGNFEDEDVSIYEAQMPTQTEVSRDTDVARTGSGSLKVSRVAGTVQNEGPTTMVI